MSALSTASEYAGAEPYRLSPDLADGSRTRALTWSAPGEADQDELLLDKLGVLGWGRLHHFRLLYPTGWGEGRGRPVSPRANRVLLAFLERFRWPAGTRPSLFLTDRGGIELAWEEHGEPLQVEFHRDGIEVYRESTGAEVELPLAEVDRAVELLA